MQFQINTAGLRCRVPETFKECQCTPCTECIAADFKETINQCQLRLKLYKLLNEVSCQTLK